MDPYHHGCPQRHLLKFQAFLSHLELKMLCLRFLEVLRLPGPRDMRVPHSSTLNPTTLHSAMSSYHLGRNFKT